MHFGCACVERGSRKLAIFSVAPQSRHSLHYGVIKFYDDGQITCNIHRGSKYCEHKAVFGQSVNISLTAMRGLHEEMFKARLPDRKPLIVKPLSQRKIPVHRLHRFYCPDYYDDWRDYPEYDEWDWTKRDFMTSFVCEFDKCCGCGTSLDNCATKEHSATLFTIEHSIPITVTDKICGVCGAVNYFDGLNEHILNFNGKYLYCHGLLNGFTFSFTSESRPSMNAFSVQRVASYVECQSSEVFTSRPYFKRIYASFIYRQLLKFLELCPLCDRGLLADINGEATGEVNEIVADGVQTGFSRRYAHLVCNPKHIFDEHFVVNNIVTTSDRFIANPRTRKLLDRYLYQHLPPISRDRVCLSNKFLVSDW